MGPVGEPGNVSDLDEQPGRAGRSDAMQPGEGPAGGGEQLARSLLAAFLRR